MTCQGRLGAPQLSWQAERIELRMDETKEKKLLDGICAILALIALAGFAYPIVTGQIFHMGVDGLFFAMMSLLFALMFGLGAAWTWLGKRAAASAASRAAGHAASVANGLFLPVVGDEHAHVPTSTDTRRIS